MQQELWNTDVDLTACEERSGWLSQERSIGFWLTHCNIKTKPSTNHNSRFQVEANASLDVHAIFGRRSATAKRKLCTSTCGILEALETEHSLHQSCSVSGKVQEEWAESPLSKEREEQHLAHCRRMSSVPRCRAVAPTARAVLNRTCSMHILNLNRSKPSNRHQTGTSAKPGLPQQREHPVRFRCIFT